MPDVRYEIIIYWSEPDQAFVAEVPEFPGWCRGRVHLWRRAGAGRGRDAAVDRDRPRTGARHSDAARSAGMPPAALAKTLLQKYGVWTVAIDTANVHGARITPHVYISTAELDAFVNALKELAA